MFYIRKLGLQVKYKKEKVFFKFSVVRDLQGFFLLTTVQFVRSVTAVHTVVAFLVLSNTLTIGTAELID